MQNDDWPGGPSRRSYQSPAELLAQTAAAGLSVSEEDGRLVVRGPKQAEGLAQQLLARKAEVLSVVRSRPAPLPLPAWDQAEAARLLSEGRAAVAHASAEHRAGRMTEARLGAVRTWQEVCEGYAANHEFESQRGWDAMQLLRNATRHLAVAAGDTAPRFQLEQK